MDYMTKLAGMDCRANAEYLQSTGGWAESRTLDMSHASHGRGYRNHATPACDDISMVFSVSDFLFEIQPVSGTFHLHQLPYLMGIAGFQSAFFSPCLFPRTDGIPSHPPSKDGKHPTVR
jgi:hypothetical protein